MRRFLVARRAARAGRGAARLDGDGIRPHAPVHRLSVGPARLQPGDVLPIAQFASVLGVYGVSALVASRERRACRRGAETRVRRRPRSWRRLVGAIAVWGSIARATRRSTRSGQPLRVGLVQGNVDQAQKWDVSRSVGHLRGLPGHDARGDRPRRGARDVARVVHAVPVRRRPDGRRTSSGRCAEGRACRSCSAAIRSSGSGPAPDAGGQGVQLRVSGPGRRHDRRRLPQDASGAVRRVRAAQATAVLRRRRSSRPSARISRPATEPTCCRSAATGQHGDLLRGRLPGSRPAVRARRQRAADDDHQRRVVRPTVGAVPALRAGVDARDRRTAAIWCAPPTPASAASSIRTAACSTRTGIFEPAVVVGDVRFLHGDDALRADRRRLRLRVRSLALRLALACVIAATATSGVDTDSDTPCRPSTI